MAVFTKRLNVQQCRNIAKECKSPVRDDILKT